MKIDDETVAAMVDLIHRMAAKPASCWGAEFDDRAEARDIAASLPKPVDPEKEACREILRDGDWAESCILDDSNSDWADKSFGSGLALAAFRAGRQFQRENG